MNIEELLTRIADLLETQAVPDWAQAFRQLLLEFQQDPHAAKASIRSVYGGMGSFSDLVLHGPNGIPLQKENNELDQMRTELYERCRYD